MKLKESSHLVCNWYWLYLKAKYNAYIFRYVCARHYICDIHNAYFYESYGECIVKSYNIVMIGDFIFAWVNIYVFLVTKYSAVSSYFSIHLKANNTEVSRLITKKNLKGIKYWCQINYYTSVSVREIKLFKHTYNNIAFFSTDILQIKKNRSDSNNQILNSSNLANLSALKMILLWVFVNNFIFSTYTDA